ncbi:alpha-ribazole phosphatase [Tritonibacter multivorans]|uniref:Alpha-ribazole phosphatase n=1 Tax=Tritonibacter multivorans TaxID=928856 RepID=A0A0P1GUX9_9RHOB|nr:histidine phosphatase family protein [Tritonibacter multivorans]MDA7419847.1 histidine phosphatase family protein [Tritonibacter multivorans]CUH79208.1 alpha-ribazole phosphatase [Tritonibacter multivorans]SFC14847.1 Broad specificity phosphatase PhoE [Tritonibacter multivorans]
MTQITLVRHGQANTEARDEISYDRLSPLGHQQAGWLGDHLRDSRDYFTRVYSGTLNRHVETATSMGYGDGLVQDPRLNEMSYFPLAEAVEAQYGTPIPTNREGFIDHLPYVFDLWQRDQIDAPYETWNDFESRISAALVEIAAGEGPALVVTSGGLIGIVMRQALGLDTKATARMVLAAMNTSVHVLHQIGGHYTPVLYNAVPHLADPDRHFARTHL